MRIEIIAPADRMPYIQHCADCGATVGLYLQNSAFCAARPGVERGDYAAVCDNADCSNHIGEDYFQDKPDWVIPSAGSGYITIGLDLAKPDDAHPEIVGTLANHDHGDIWISRIAYCQYGVVSVSADQAEAVEAYGWRRICIEGNRVLVSRYQKDRP